MPKIRISSTLIDEMEEAMDDAAENLRRKTPDPTDPVYLKIKAAKPLKAGVVIEADEADIAELLSRATYKIEVAHENMSDQPEFWRGQLATWRALVKQISQVSTVAAAGGGTGSTRPLIK